MVFLQLDFRKDTFENFSLGKEGKEEGGKLHCIGVHDTIAETSKLYHKTTFELSSVGLGRQIWCNSILPKRFEGTVGTDLRAQEKN